VASPAGTARSVLNPVALGLFEDGSVLEVVLAYRTY